MRETCIVTTTDRDIVPQSVTHAQSRTIVRAVTYARSTSHAVNIVPAPRAMSAIFHLFFKAPSRPSRRRRLINHRALQQLQ